MTSFDDEADDASHRSIINLLNGARMSQPVKLAARTDPTPPHWLLVDIGEEARGGLA